MKEQNWFFVALITIVLCQGCNQSGSTSREEKAAVNETTSSASASEPALSPEEAVKQTFKSLLELCGEGNIKEAAQYVAYGGSDQSRKYKDSLDYGNPDERSRVENTCEKARRALEISDSHSIVNYETEKESEGEWHVVEVVFKKGDEEIRKYFAFLAIQGGRFVLGDID